MSMGPWTSMTPVVTAIEKGKVRYDVRQWQDTGNVLIWKWRVT